jgi:hypothetical protein
VAARRRYSVFTTDRDFDAFAKVIPVELHLPRSSCRTLQEPVGATRLTRQRSRPMTRYGSSPETTASGSGVSGDSCESCWQAYGRRRRGVCDMIPDRSAHIDALRARRAPSGCVIGG